MALRIVTRLCLLSLLCLVTCADALAWYRAGAEVPAEGHIESSFGVGIPQ